MCHTPRGSNPHLHSSVFPNILVWCSTVELRGDVWGVNGLPGANLKLMTYLN